MIFSSYTFIFVFFPIIYGVYLLLNGFKQYKPGKIWLILGSLFFFYKGSPTFFPLFLCTLLFNFGIGKALVVWKEKPRALRLTILLVGLAENIGLLFYYKYTNFFIKIINGVFQKGIAPLDLLLPLGISFFTFRMISYIVDCYDNKARDYSPMEYLLFITFFPPLIIGPMARHDDLIPQFNKESQPIFNSENVIRGFFIFAIGCGKKVLIATPLLTLANTILHTTGEINPLILWLGAFVNLFAFYFDFSGYTDMAIGLGYFFNIVLPENFNSPYKARNVQDYWQRWHITLGKFLGDYIFKRIYKRHIGILSFCFATMVTFGISGFWHGAEYTFILWGLLNGFLVCIVAVIAIYSPKKYLLPKYIGIPLTMITLAMLATLYSSPNIGTFFHTAKNMVNPLNIRTLGVVHTFQQLGTLIVQNFTTIIVFMVGIIITYWGKTTKALAKKATTLWYYPFLTAVIFAISLFLMGTTSDFVYFRF